MKNKLLLIVSTAAILAIPKINFGQAPTMGTAANFVLFSSVGAVSNTGITHLTGNVGTNSGSSTGFGNVDGVMHDVDLASAQCSVDLLLAYNQLNVAVPTFAIAPLLGSGQILVPGVYSIPSPATLNLGLTLDGLGDPNAVFIFQINGAFSTNPSSKIYLVNGTKACNVFWKVEGLVSMAAGTTMRGTVIANNSAINLSIGDTLEGRALSTNGAVTVNGILAYTPIGCGSPVLTGPMPPNLASTVCYALFSSIGPVTNVGVTNVIGDVGTDNGLTTGYNPLLVVGTVHPIPDGSTAICAVDLLSVYNYLNVLPFDIELLYPPLFGNNLVLTPHTYRMNGAVTFTDSLYLDAQGNANAVFVFQINGALSTSTFSKVKLINGAQSKNVFWKVEGAVSINNNSVFRGTIICNNGAISLNTNVTLDGRALTTTGALNTSAVNVIIPPGCGSVPSPSITTEPIPQTVCAGSSASFSVSATGSSLTYQWRKGTVNLINGGNISGATSPVLTINPVSILNASLNYNVVVSSPSAISDTSINVSLTVNTAPNITTEPVSQTRCVGSSVSFSVAATGPGLTYQWRKGTINLINSGIISGVTTSSLTINPVSLLDASTNYNVIVMGTCLPNDTSINVTLTVNQGPVVNANSNSPVCVDSTIYLTATSIVGGVYSWAGPNSYTSSIQNPLIINSSTLNAGSYILSVSNGTCTSTASVIYIEVNNCVNIDFNIPEGFSPNGDGINDVFVIRGIDYYPQNKFDIFNRWGNKVFEAKPYQNNWDGKTSQGLRVGGDDLPVGTYFYFLDLGNNTPIYKGTIYLNK